MHHIFVNYHKLSSLYSVPRLVSTHVHIQLLTVPTPTNPQTVRFIAVLRMVCYYLFIIIMRMESYLVNDGRVAVSFH